MTENIKKLLELVSGSEELKDKLNNATKETVIAVAKEHGISLTDADFEANKSEISDEELCTVAGGKACFCVGGGGGTGESSKENRTCACVAVGEGCMENGRPRCVCLSGGIGRDKEVLT